ncbi:MAG: glycosyl transferase family 2 [Mesorhizobium sp.]|nr:glycosyl transferase family 2 [Mesorhizobium sp.]MBN9241658.1 glycosyl transferase family 2 [Mesorhizobium sp.]
MLSVLIQTLDDEEGLARTLACLVGAAVEGAVREVIVCDGGSGDGTLAVAEHAGCRVATDGIADAIGGARSDWLLVLEPGARLEDGWTDEVAVHVGRSAIPARFSRAPGSRAPFLSRLMARPTALAQGLLIPKRRAIAAHANDAETLARGLATTTLHAGIWPAPARRKP